MTPKIWRRISAGRDSQEGGLVIPWHVVTVSVPAMVEDEEERFERELSQRWCKGGVAEGILGFLGFSLISAWSNNTTRGH